MIRVDGSWQDTGTTGSWAIGRIGEAKVPLSAIKALPGGKIFAYVALIRNNEEVGRWPTDAPLLLNYKGEALELENWLI